MSHWVLIVMMSCIGNAELDGLPPGAATATVITDVATRSPGAGQPPVTMMPPPDAGTTAMPVPDAGITGCSPGFIFDAGMCFPGDPGIPAQRSEAQVCAAYRAGMTVTAPMPFTKTAATCDPGVLVRGGIDDALARLNMYRYLAGLGPTVDSASDNANAQGCALVSAWNPAGPAAHFPQPTATCYTPAGAAGAGSSNIAWGCRSPGDSIDQWMVDYGNDTTFGHRRWLLNPPLGPIGYGYYEGGNNYGSASCIGVFGSSMGGPRPAVISWPPPGFVPVELATMTWTAQGDVPFQDAGVSIIGPDGGELGGSLYFLQGSYGGSGAVRIDRSGWTPRAGEIYRVALTGEGHAPIVYEVKPISCP